MKYIIAQNPDLSLIQPTKEELERTALLFKPEQPQRQQILNLIEEDNGNLFI